MTTHTSLAGKLLLAMPGMLDPRFERSVSIICAHDEDGALGIGIGSVREQIGFRALLEEVGVEPGDTPERQVLEGGPVEPGRGFILHSNDWSGPETLEVSQLCSLSASIEVLRAIATGEGPERWLMALGYAGWGAGQLEEEMTRHGWYVAEASEALIFDTAPEARWMATWRAEGIDPALLASDSGHA